MALSIPLVWSDAHRLHEPDAEIWVGVRTPAVEIAERAERIRAALTEAGAPVVEAERHDDAALLAVHDAALLEFLATAWEEWERAGLPVDPGQDRVVPYIFPHPGLTAGLEPAVPAATWARTGAFCFDTMTLIGPGTWEAAAGAADAALTAADLVAGGAAAAYACCRPPGHHVTRSAYGGSCYLNNAAIAAARLRDRACGAGRDRRRRRAPRQRGAVDLLGARRRLHRLGPRRSRSRLVPALHRRRGRARCRRGSRREPQSAAVACRRSPATGTTTGSNGKFPDHESLYVDPVNGTSTSTWAEFSGNTHSPVYVASRATRARRGR